MENKYNITKNNYDLSKMEETKKQLEDLTIKTSIVSADVFLAMGIKPPFREQLTQEMLDSGRQICLRAENIMRSRVNGETEFNISMRQYEQFLVDCKEKTKLFSYGYESLDCFYEWLMEQINVIGEEE